MNRERKIIWEEAERKFNSPLPKVYIAKERARMDHDGYNAQDVFADPLQSPDSIQRAAQNLYYFPRMNVENLNDFLSLKFPGGMKPKLESKGKILNPVFRSDMQNLYTTAIVMREWRGRHILWRFS